MRNSYTWKLNKEENAEKINEWLDSQKNIRDSLSFAVQLMQQHLGNVDIRSFENANELMRLFQEAQSAQPQAEKETAAASDSARPDRRHIPSPFEEEDDDWAGVIDKGALFGRK
ncbi:hypothetical protein JCM19037_1341 [Geomicrobium sp. JCM 19037]|uniref:hypothetical protein n=1 Tax=unclassified Geomicrobium TaxID=2628951 RepID=UPI00045F3B6B|nr:MULTISPECIES: hypothetical protein [unclassified Geomicrobium]GAK03057.1 hypothetical protein JCM19037_1341 [Geomicrobium sp. JCM 19037]GAK13978.1 hypothetical protein JCM19039_3866 [Geomicrobium sp. JCM 19039]